MISAGSSPADELRVTPPDARFDLNAPRINPLVASGTVLLTKERDHGIAVTWDTAPEPDPVKNVLRDATDYARRDMLRFPRSARAHANLGIALAKSSQFAEAIDELKIALSIDPHHYIAGTTLAGIFAKNGQFAEAKGLYEELLKEFPSSDSILLSLAYLSLRAGLPDVAERYVELALRTNKRRAYPNYLLGVIRLIQKNPRGAIAALREATRLEVRTGVFHHALGVAYALSSDNARAERCFRVALTLSPDATEPLHALCSVLLSENRPDEVLDVLKGHVQLNDGDTETRELLARAYIGLTKYASARAQLMYVLNTFGDRLSPLQKSSFRTNVATTFWLEGNLRSAEAELNRAIEAAPKVSPLPYEKLGGLYIRSGRLEEAIAILRVARHDFPQRQNVRRLLSSAYSGLNLFDLAISELRPFWLEGTADAEAT